MNGVRRAAAACLLVAGLGVAATVLHAGDARYPPSPQAERLLYVRSGEAARRLALTFRGLMADVYWIRTIQHFGRDRRSARTTGRFELLQPLLDLTTSLDPHFSIAYRFGSIFLSMAPPDGPGRPDQATALLEKGLAASPDRWQYAYDLGFVNYLFAGDYKKAGEWFTRAAAMPGAPVWLSPLAASTVAQGGDRSGARRLLTELLSSDQEYLRKDAVRGLAQLNTLDAIDRVQAAVEAYHASEHVYPASWADLIRANRLPGVPTDAAHVALLYDATSHTVTVSPTSPLAPLPTALVRR
jgi:tetratricopeptide (TPR) repeat protein